MTFMQQSGISRVEKSAIFIVGVMPISGEDCTLQTITPPDTRQTDKSMVYTSIVQQSAARPCLSGATITTEAASDSPNVDVVRESF